MVSVVAINTAPVVPLPLVVTSLPGASAVSRVPYDNVVPSVSNARIENNASGNRNALPKAEPQVVANAPPAGGEFSAPTTNLSGASIGTAQTFFLAQLAGQELSPEVRGIFVQYEKLVSYGAVKYKPSDAGKPSPAAGLFSQILKGELPAAPVIESSPVVDDTPVDIDGAAVETDTSIAMMPQTPVAAASEASALFKQFAAYSDTVVRNNLAAQTRTSDIVSEELA